MLEPSVRHHLHQATAAAEFELGAWVNRTNSSLRAWWNNMGHVGQVGEQADMLRARVTQVERTFGEGATICEVGLNAGHSAILFLSGLRTHLIEFDKLDLPYSTASRALLEALYPN